jgi:anti-sigma regulatory factor (Ser/Thr protein kinase)
LGVNVIKTNSSYYRVWKKHQNEKNLIKRTQKRKWNKSRLTAQNIYNYNLKRKGHYDSEIRKYSFIAPLDFSFINNTEETCEFFNEIIKFILDDRNYKKSVFVDVSKIKTFTIDALMYLLAIINNLRDGKNKISFSGNEPVDSNVRRTFRESGFYHYVNYRGKVALTKNEDSFQIVTGENSAPEVARKISEFVMDRTGTKKQLWSFLYIIMIELMSNTHKHAYNNNALLSPHWYCYVDYDGQNLLSFTFMDTGEGIPSTVRKNFIEKIDLLKLKSEGKYVESALKGDFRTETELSYRGKGLPKIREFCSNNKIQNMKIITNHAKVAVNKKNIDARETDAFLKGTLYYWQIDIKNLKGE